MLKLCRRLIFLSVKTLKLKYLDSIFLCKSKCVELASQKVLIFFIDIFFLNLAGLRRELFKL